MTYEELYLAAGLPAAIAFVGILVNVGNFVVLNARMKSLELKIETRFDLLMGKGA